MEQELRLNKDAEAALDQIDAELKRSTSRAGGTDAAALHKTVEFLMSLADIACPVNP